MKWGHNASVLKLEEVREMALQQGHAAPDIATLMGLVLLHAVLVTPSPIVGALM
jgi:hypothetical protein